MRKKVFEMSAPIDTRLKLMPTASSLSGKSNYDNAALGRDSASRLGLSKGAFYHHFQSNSGHLLVHANAYWNGPLFRQNLDQIFSPRFTALEQAAGDVKIACSKAVNVSSEKRCIFAACRSL